MAFRVGDKVRINFPEGVNWVKKSGQNTFTASDVQGAIGPITQALGNTGQAEYKVNLSGIGEFRFWERDLAPAEATAEAPESAEGVESSQEDFSDGPSEQIQ